MGTHTPSPTSASRPGSVAPAACRAHHGADVTRGARPSFIAGGRCLRDLHNICEPLLLTQDLHTPVRVKEKHTGAEPGL